VRRGGEQGNEARAKDRASLSMTGAEAEGAFDSEGFRARQKCLRRNPQRESSQKSWYVSKLLLYTIHIPSTPSTP
jgi:hypothetical protein